MFAARTAWELSPNRLSLALERHRAQGRPLIDLTASNPTQIGLEYDGTAILHALSQAAALNYDPQPFGLESARRAVCGYYAAQGSDISPGAVLLTTGTSEGYSFLFRLLCDPGDEVLAPVPIYPLFDFLAGLQDVSLVSYCLFYDHGWQIDFASLRTKLTPRTRAILLVHPNNPTGSYVQAGERKRLNELAREHKLALIVDEVFLDFAHPSKSTPPASFAANQGALTFTLSGLSKIAGLPQMKFSWIVVSGPEPARSEALKRLEIIADTYLSMNAPIQLAAPAWLAGRHAFQESLKRRIAANLATLDLQLQRQILCSRLQIEGGWYAVLRVPATASDEDLAIALLEREQVLVHPGHFYDFAGEGFLVVSLIAAEDRFREGIARLLRFLG